MRSRWLRGLMTIALFAIATCAFGESYGSIGVVPRDGFTAPLLGYYYEHRFAISNRSLAPHVVELRLDNSGRGSSEHVSRSFQIAPRSETIVTVPQLTTGYFLPDSAVVIIDGQRQEQTVRFSQISTWEADANPDLLLGRTVPQPTGKSFDPFRAQVGPGEWSTNWLSYGRFAAVVLAPADWLELPQPVQTAIRRWVFAGGTLVLLDPQRTGTATEERHGAGHILNIGPAEFEDQSAMLRLTQWRARDTTAFRTGAHTMPIFRGDPLPVRALFVVLLLFAIVGGPLSLYWLAKKNRRMWIFVTLPLFAVVTSILLVGATLANEGWVRIERSFTLTLLDENEGQAATFGWAGFYSTFAPRGEVRFDSETELRTIFATGGNDLDAETRWDDGQRLFGSWVGTRVPTYFVVRKSEPRRERLAMQRGGAGAVNGLGGHIDHIWLANEKGEIFTAANVAPGQAFVFQRATDYPNVRADVPYRIDQLLHLDQWTVSLPIVGGDPTAILQPRMYVAAMHDATFLERALSHPTVSTHRQVVIGLMKPDGELPHAR